MNIIETIDNSDNILLISHVNPDGDTLGSAGAVGFYLQQVEKSFDLYCVDSLSINFKYMGLDGFFIHPATLDTTKYDLIIAVDCADPLRTGIAEEIEKVKGKATIINIDHHGTNPNYGDINIVKADASSTCEIIYDLFQENNISINKDMATCLITGILTDTGYFSNAATTSSAIAASSYLMSRGVSQKIILDSVWKNQSLETLKFWGEIMSRLHYNEKSKVVTAIITPAEGVEKEIFEGFSNFLTIIYEADITLVLFQTPDGKVKASMRTTRDHIDVAKIAKRYGGGGHRKAAGFTVEGRVVEDGEGWRIVR
jgi:bifunctional oligoribonuclease and PAP phosphatase NrnA